MAPVTTPRRTGVLRRIVNHRADTFMCFPALAVMLIVIAYPVYYTIELSFFKTPANLQMKDKIFVGLDNYVTILTSASFRHVTINTLIWTVFSTFFAFVLGLCAALALHREFAGRGILRAVLLIPYVVSPVAASYVWKALPFRLRVMARLGPVRLHRRPINFPTLLHCTSVLIVGTSGGSSLPIMLMAGLHTVPISAARRAGGRANPGSALHVTFPHLKGIMVTVRCLRWPSHSFISMDYYGGGPRAF